jgi:hypothetical protein
MIRRKVIKTLEIKIKNTKHHIKSKKHYKLISKGSYRYTMVSFSFYWYHKQMFLYQTCMSVQNGSHPPQSHETLCCMFFQCITILKWKNT